MERASTWQSYDEGQLQQLDPLKIPAQNHGLQPEHEGVDHHGKGPQGIGKQKGQHKSRARNRRSSEPCFCDQADSQRAGDYAGHKHRVTFYHIRIFHSDHS